MLSVFANINIRFARISMNGKPVRGIIKRKRPSQGANFLRRPFSGVDDGVRTHDP